MFCVRVKRIILSNSFVLQSGECYSVYSENGISKKEQANSCIVLLYCVQSKSRHINKLCNILRKFPSTKTKETTAAM